MELKIGTWIKNQKTGTEGKILNVYNSTSTGKKMIEVFAIGQSKPAHWLASSVESNV